jgi:F1F0 ATPase subunit 2
MLVRLEMDGERMSLPLFEMFPAWVKVVGLAAHLAAGITLGVLYFRSLWWNVRQYIGGTPVVTTIALTIGRFVLLGGLLTLASREGALPLLMLSLGVMVGRSVVMGRVGEPAP